MMHFLMWAGILPLIFQPPMVNKNIAIAFNILTSSVLSEYVINIIINICPGKILFYSVIWRAF